MPLGKVIELNNTKSETPVNYEFIDNNLLLLVHQLDQMYYN